MSTMLNKLFSPWTPRKPPEEEEEPPKPPTDEEDVDSTSTASERSDEEEDLSDWFMSNEQFAQLYSGAAASAKEGRDYKLGDKVVMTADTDDGKGLTVSFDGEEADVLRTTNYLLVLHSLYLYGRVNDSLDDDLDSFVHYLEPRIVLRDSVAVADFLDYIDYWPTRPKDVADEDMAKQRAGTRPAARKMSGDVAVLSKKQAASTGRPPSPRLVKHRPKSNGDGGKKLFALSDWPGFLSADDRSDMLDGLFNAEAGIKQPESCQIRLKDHDTIDVDGKKVLVKKSADDKLLPYLRPKTCKSTLDDLYNKGIKEGAFAENDLDAFASYLDKHVVVGPHHAALDLLNGTTYWTNKQQPFASLRVQRVAARSAESSGLVTGIAEEQQDASTALPPHFTPSKAVLATHAESVDYEPVDDLVKEPQATATARLHVADQLIKPIGHAGQESGAPERLADDTQLDDQRALTSLGGDAQEPQLDGQLLKDDDGFVEKLVRPLPSSSTPLGSKTPKGKQPPPPLMLHKWTSYKLSEAELRSLEAEIDASPTGVIWKNQLAHHLDEEIVPGKRIVTVSSKRGDYVHYGEPDNVSKLLRAHYFNFRAVETGASKQAFSSYLNKHVHLGDSFMAFSRVTNWWEHKPEKAWQEWDVKQLAAAMVVPGAASLGAQRLATHPRQLAVPVGATFYDGHQNQPFDPRAAIAPYQGVASWSGVGQATSSFGAIGAAYNMHPETPRPMGSAQMLPSLGAIGPNYPVVQSIYFINNSTNNTYNHNHNTATHVYDGGSTGDIHGSNSARNDADQGLQEDIKTLKQGMQSLNENVGTVNQNVLNVNENVGAFGTNLGAVSGQVSGISDQVQGVSVKLGEVQASNVELLKTVSKAPASSRCRRTAGISSPEEDSLERSTDSSTLWGVPIAIAFQQAASPQVDRDLVDGNHPLGVDPQVAGLELEEPVAAGNETESFVEWLKDCRVKLTDDEWENLLAAAREGFVPAKTQAKGRPPCKLCASKIAKTFAPGNPEGLTFLCGSHKGKEDLL